MAHIHSVYDTDTHFMIDGVSRTVKNVSSTKTMVVQHDHNSERFTFEIPRMVDGHDMTTCNVVQVHYINVEYDNTKSEPKSKTGVYEVDDVRVSPEDNDTVTCSWVISGNATQYVGTLSFALRFACVSNDGVLEYAWNTAVHKNVYVTNGIYNGEFVAEQYADILEQWRKALHDEGRGAFYIIDTAHHEAIDHITAMSSQTLAEVDAARSEALQRIAENGGVTDEEVQVAVGNYIASHPASGLNTNTKNILMYLLRSAVYTADVSQVIQMLDEMWYEDVTEVYSITNNLTDVVNSNAEISISAGKTYTATLTPAVDNYVLDTVTITMGGEDVTASVYADGEINIPIVTGAIIITAVAVEFQGLVLEVGAIGTDGYDIEQNNRFRTVDFIPYRASNNTILANFVFNGSSNNIKFIARPYDSNKNPLTDIYPDMVASVTSHNIFDPAANGCPGGFCWNNETFTLAFDASVAYVRVLFGNYSNDEATHAGGTITVSGVEYELEEV